MYNDTPDWSGQYNSASLLPLNDLGELAARLGSPVISDRRGAFLWFDDFELGLAHFVAQTSGANSAVDLVADVVNDGAFACRLQTDYNAGNYATIYKWLTLPLDSRLGLAVSFYGPHDHIVLDMVMWLATPTTAYEAIVRIDFYTGNVKVNTASGYVTFATDVVLTAGSGGWPFAKLVVDKSTLKYERFTINGTEYDLSAYNIPVYSAATDNSLKIQLTAWGQNVAPRAIAVHVDNVVVTQNEPPNS